jgi:hypothetical protein
MFFGLSRLVCANGECYSAPLKSPSSPASTHDKEGEVHMGKRSPATVRRWATAVLVVAVGQVGTASATLIDRGPDLLYDDVLNITWTRQAGDGVQRTWRDAMALADSLVFAGSDDWRLPWASVSAGAGPVTSVVNCATATELACRDNEMGHLFYYDLGGTWPHQDHPGDLTALSGELVTGIHQRYWSATRAWVRPEDGLSDVWNAWFNPGMNVSAGEFAGLHAWFAASGDIARVPDPPAVPEPATGLLMLFGLGAGGLEWSRRNRRSSLSGPGERYQK